MMGNNSDPARESAKSHVQSIWDVIRFLPGGVARMFGPLFVWAATQPVLHGIVGEPLFGQLAMVIFALSLYWTHLHSLRFKGR